MGDIDKALDEVKARHAMLPARGGSADITFLLDRLAASEARTRELEATVQRVERVHVRRAECGSTDCEDCPAHCEGCYETWPCPTVRALRGSDV